MRISKRKCVKCGHVLDSLDFPQLVASLRADLDDLRTEQYRLRARNTVLHQKLAVAESGLQTVECPTCKGNGGDGIDRGEGHRFRFGPCKRCGGHGRLTFDDLLEEIVAFEDCEEISQARYEIMNELYEKLRERDARIRELEDQIHDDALQSRETY